MKGALTNWFRKNTGFIVSAIGLTLLVILTFGNIGELLTDEYWQNVGGNLSSIGALTIGLVLIQTAIKQGVSEQALSAGLNTKDTKEKYDDHKKIIKDNFEKQIYLPYFLTFRNERETKRKKREFLVDNGFTSEKSLRMSKHKRLIKLYDSIQVNNTVDSIKWSTTEIRYDKNGRIEKLEAYRKKRALKGIFAGIFWMIAAAFITGGLFLDSYQIPFWQKLVKLLTYLITIALSVIFDIGKNYEKGAFGVPNELEEVNSIWREFQAWEVPSWVIAEVESEGQERIEEPKEEKKIEEVAKEELKEEATEKTADKPILLGFIEKKEIEKEEVGNERSEEFDIGRTLQEESEEIKDS
jgi:hypothetical protein